MSWDWVGKVQLQVAPETALVFMESTQVSTFLADTYCNSDKQVNPKTWDIPGLPRLTIMLGIPAVFEWFDNSKSSYFNHNHSTVQLVLRSLLSSYYTGLGPPATLQRGDCSCGIWSTLLTLLRTIHDLASLPSLLMWWSPPAAEGKTHQTQKQLLR